MFTVSRKDPYRKSAFAAHLMITSRCNLKCYYCYYPPQKNPDMSSAQAKYIVQQVETLGEGNVWFDVSGGEPLLNPEWKSIAETCLATNHDIMLNTNGSLISTNNNIEKLLELYQRYGTRLYLSVSLDSYTSEINDFVRGKYTEVTQGLALLHEAHIPFRISMTLSRYNRDTVCDTVRYIVEHYTQDVLIGIIHPVFTMTPEYRASLLSLDEVHAVYREVQELKSELDFNFFHSVGSDGTLGCSAGRDRVAIGVNGDIYPCYALRNVVIGNVFTDGLKIPFETYRSRVAHKPDSVLLCESTTNVQLW